MDLGPQIVRNSYQYLLVQSGANPIRLGNNGSVNWAAGGVVASTGNQTISGAKTFANGATVSGGFNVVGGGTNYFGSGFSTNHFGSGAVINYFGSEAAGNIIGSQFSANSLNGNWQLNGNLNITGSLYAQSPEPININVTGTLSGPIGSVSQIAPRTVIVNNTVYRNSGKWITDISLRQNPNATITFLDVEGMVVTSSVGIGSVTTLWPALKIIDSLGTLLSSNPTTGTITFPVLEIVYNTIQSGGAVNASALNFPELTSVINGISISFINPNITSIAIPKIVVCGNLGCSSTVLQTITLPEVGVWKDAGQSISLSGTALNQTTVNNLLAHLAYMDGNNSTRLFGSGATVNIAGGTSSPPSNLGSVSTPGSNFVCAGTTCTVTMTNHGYTTGTVLRISGVTTATNANRYAVITVLNANQFTYTITSQNATGAGTATVIRAGASASALVTRGVTLTTN